MKRRLLAWITVCALAAVCVSAWADVVTIDYWHFYGGEIGKVHQQAIDKFNAEHPDIQIKAQYIGSAWTGRDKLLTAIAGGTPPDIALVDDYWVSELAATGHIVKLGDRIDEETKADVFPLFWEAASYEGEVWAMPYAASNVVLYYNKDMFRAAGLDPDAPPTTWAQLAEYAQKLTKTDEWGFTTPTTAADGNIYNYLPFLWQVGGELFNADFTHCIVDSPEGVAALQFLQDLVYTYNAMPSAPPKNGFQSGIVAMEMASSAKLVTYRPQVKFDLGVAVLPVGEKGVSSTVAGGKFFTLFGDSKLDAAMTFIKYMTSEEHNINWSIATGYIPLRQSVVASAEFQTYLAENPLAKPAVDQIAYTRNRPSLAAYGDISRVIGNAIEAALIGNVDPATALSGCITEADQTLADWVERLK